MTTVLNRAAPAGSSSREKILDVAETLFARRSFSGVGMREVADAVGFGKSSLFHHFRSKLQLYGEVLGRVLTRIDGHLQPVLAADVGPLEKLDRWLDSLIDALAEQPAWSRLLLRALFEDEAFPEADTPERAAAERAMQSIIGGCDALLRDGIASGVFRRVSVAHTIQTVIGSTIYHFASGRFGDELLGRPMLSADEVGKRKESIRSLFHHGLVA
jgi:AcrR family transcriptional regulator